MIHLHAVSKAYHGRPALHPTTLTIPAGECHALVGESGSGKSTLLRLSLGLITPDSGSVRLGEHPLRRENARTLRHGVGYVIQEGGLFPHLTAAENVSLLARHLGWEPSRIQRRLTELRELVRLPDGGLDRYPGQLSGGQRQRVGVMRALMLDPPLLLMDEPFGALDPITRAQLQDDLREIIRQLGKTVLLVTHSLAEAAYLAGRISVMHEGRILQTGSFRELADRPADPYVTRLIAAERTLPLEAAR